MTCDSRRHRHRHGPERDLCVLCRMCAFAASRAGARDDVFRVLADIGDMQTVSGDLSTFSGHFVVCRNILREVASAHVQGLHSLVLSDEIGTGTVPVQCAALAQTSPGSGCSRSTGGNGDAGNRHHALPRTCHRKLSFQNCSHGICRQPSYVAPSFLGSVSESLALEAGPRMHLTENLLARAHALMDDESRRIVALQHRLER